MLREIVVVGGWMIFYGSLFLFLLSIYMLAKIDSRKEWLSLVAPLEFSFIGLFFILVGSRSVDICLFLPLVIVWSYISRKMRWWEKWIDLCRQYSQLSK